MHSGIVAEFDSPDTFVRAYDRLVDQGYERLASWTPYPVRGVLLRTPPSIVGWLMLGGGAVGGTLGYAIQWWCNARSYPIDVGGRPLQSIPAFVPITFESVVLFACLTGFVSMLALSGLPRLHHPVFDVPGFERASIDRFFIGIDDADDRFDDRLMQDLLDWGALRCERLGALR